jgi:hypothetical protein
LVFSTTFFDAHPTITKKNPNNKTMFIISR